MAKPATIKIRLNSTADTGFFYVTKKNPRTMTEKMVKRKYDPVAKNSSCSETCHLPTIFAKFANSLDYATFSGTTSRISPSFHSRCTN